VTSSSVRLGVLLLVYVAFVSLGLPDGVLGAAWPQMRAELGVGLNQNWRMLALGTCGSVVSSFLSGVALRRWGVGWVLVVTTFVTALAILSYSRSATFALLTALAFLLGLGNGAIDAGLNHFVASNLSSRHMSWLHGFWSQRRSRLAGPGAARTWPSVRSSSAWRSHSWRTCTCYREGRRALPASHGSSRSASAPRCGYARPGPAWLRSSSTAA
jgi:MFS family permease